MLSVTKNYSINYKNITYGDVLMVDVNVTSNYISVNEGQVIIALNNQNYTANIKRFCSY